MTEPKKTSLLFHSLENIMYIIMLEQNIKKIKDWPPTKRGGKLKKCFKYVNKITYLRGEWDSLVVSVCVTWASAMTLDVWHTCMNTLPLCHSHFFRTLWRRGWIPSFSTFLRFSLLSVSAEEGGSMTCKDTPLRQRLHMEVLQRLLGKQEGVWRWKEMKHTQYTQTGCNQWWNNVKTRIRREDQSFTGQN